MEVFLILAVITFQCNAFEQDPCTSYKILYDDGSRSTQCDIYYKYRHDRFIDPGWRRVQMESIKDDLMMPTECVPYGNCGSHSSIWLNGTHPSTEDGIVNRTGCLSMFSSCCYTKYPIQIKNCSSFMVYNLKRTLGSDERYCFGDSRLCYQTKTASTTASTNERIYTRTITTNYDRNQTHAIDITEPTPTPFLEEISNNINEDVTDIPSQPAGTSQNPGKYAHKTTNGMTNDVEDSNIITQTFGITPTNTKSVQRIMKTSTKSVQKISTLTSRKTSKIRENDIRTTAPTTPFIKESKEYPYPVIDRPAHDNHNPDDMLTLSVSLTVVTVILAGITVGLAVLLLRLRNRKKYNASANQITKA